jgi:hypothetical protein
MANERTEAPQTTTAADKLRNWLALWVSISSIVVILIFGVVVIAWSDGKRDEAIRLVWTGVLPLVGSWVGTILAYFFSNESLRTATQTVTTLTQHLTAQERLRATKVRDKMIRRTDFKSVDNRPLDQIPVTDARQKLETAKVNRLIVLDANDLPKLVVHRSFIDRYLAGKALVQPPANLANLTLKNLVDDPAFQPLLTSTFETVREEATLEEAKAKMDQTPNCQDIFVTRTGSRSEAVLGWITNVIIEENAKL